MLSAVVLLDLHLQNWLPIDLKIFKNYQFLKKECTQKQTKLDEVGTQEKQTGNMELILTFLYYWITKTRKKYWWHKRWLNFFKKKSEKVFDFFSILSIVQTYKMKNESMLIGAVTKPKIIS